MNPVTILAFSMAICGVDPGPTGPDEHSSLRNDTQRLGWPRSVGVDETLRESSLLAKLELTSEVVWNRTESVVDAKVIQVLKGEAALVGTTIKVYGNPYSAVLPVSARTFLCVRGLAGKGSCWLVPLKKKGKDYRNSFSEGLQGTLVPKKRAAKKGAKPEIAVRDELLAALDSENDEIRHSAISALRSWDGINTEKPSGRLWKEAKVAARLLRAAGDADQRVRWTVAWMIPESAGAAGENALLRLLFDPVRMVRQPANYHLKRRGHDEIAAAWKEITDHQLDEKLSEIARSVTPRKLNAKQLSSCLASLTSHRQWQGRADKAWLLGHQKAATEITDALLTSIEDDEHFEVRRWALWSLGRVAGESDKPAVIKVLVQHARSDDEDGRIRVMAAGSLHTLGDPRGHELLVGILKQSDTRAAVQALEVLATTGSKRVLDVLLATTKDKRAVLRAFATVNLPSYKAFARHQIDSKLADLRKDESPLVRAAVEIASAKMQGPR